MIQANNFISACVSRNYTFFTGVPCSLLKPIINQVIHDDEVVYVAAASEGEAVGIASGAYMAGRKAVVMCQNSGLGNAVNPLTSLNFPFRIPFLLIVTLRGESGLDDEPQHELMGQITTGLLDTMHIPWSFFPSVTQDIDTVLDYAEKKMASTNLPYAMILKKGTVQENDLQISNPMKKREPHVFCKEQINEVDKRMSRLRSIKIIRESVSSNDALIATTGKIGRELFESGDRDSQFYVVGSMGCASGIGLGIQLVKPRQSVVVLDGDGAALMKMGTFATIGYNRPSNFIHIVIDNESYESTGGQYSVSPAVDFCNIAASCGYRMCYFANKEVDLVKAINAAKDSPGPSLIHIKVSTVSDSNLGRPTVTPQQVKKRFMEFLKRESGNV